MAYGGKDERAMCMEGLLVDAVPSTDAFAIARLLCLLCNILVKDAGSSRPRARA
jgi:hypothetical protein